MRTPNAASKNRVHAESVVTARQQLSEWIRIDRGTEIVALRLRTLVGLEKGKLFLGFYTFSNNSQLQIMAHADHRDHVGNRK